VVPVPLNVTTVRSQKDLNPVISTLRSFNKMSPLTLSFSARQFPAQRTFLKSAFGRLLRVRTHYTRRETTHRSLMEGFFSRYSHRDAVKAVRQHGELVDKTHVWQVLSQRPSRLAHGWRYGRKI
jgi:hypothetical protein